MPCPPAGDLPNLGIELVSFMLPELEGRLFITSTTWETPTDVLQISKGFSTQCSLNSHNILVNIVLVLNLNIKKALRKVR